MKLATVEYAGQQRVGVVKDDQISLLPFPGGMLQAIQQGAEGIAAARDKEETVSLDKVELLPPIPNPTKVICIGLNYGDYARAGNLTPPTRPLVFAKFPSALIGDGREIVWSPKLATQVDYEAELVVVIGKPARNVPKKDALSYIFGYTCGNDISARDLQNSDVQWVRSKSLDTFAPLGPWLVTADEIPDPQNLAIRCTVNDKVVQESSTREMIFGVASLIEFLTQSFTLVPGDLIFSGTPAGVGAFRNPPLFLGDGDRVVVEVQGIGRLANSCRTFEPGLQ